MGEHGHTLLTARGFIWLLLIGQIVFSKDDPSNISHASWEVFSSFSEECGWCPICSRWKAVSTMMPDLQG